MPRRPFEADDPWVILKRLRFVRLKLRPILYRHPIINPPYGRKEAPCWGDKGTGGWYRREITWAWEVREHVRFHVFRYSEILQIAEKFIGDMSSLTPPVDLVSDLHLLIAFREHMRELRKQRGGLPLTYAERYGEQASVEIDVENKVKTMLLDQCCPTCGDDLPCDECNVPAVKLDGKGGLCPA